MTNVDRIAARPYCAVKYPVHIKTAFGDKFGIYVTENMTPSELKNRIVANSEYKRGDLSSFLFNGIPIGRKMTLAKAGVIAGSEITLIISFGSTRKGGA